MSKTSKIIIIVFGILAYLLIVEDVFLMLKGGEDGQNSSSTEIEEISENKQNDEKSQKSNFDENATNTSSSTKIKFDIDLEKSVWSATNSTSS